MWRFSGSLSIKKQNSFLYLVRLISLVEMKMSNDTVVVICINIFRHRLHDKSAHGTACYGTVPVPWPKWVTLIAMGAFTHRWRRRRRHCHVI